MSLGLLIAGIISLPKIKKLNPIIQKKVNRKKFFYLALSLFLVQTGFYSLRFVDALMIQYIVNFTELGLYSAYSSITNGIRLVAYVFPAVIVPLAAVSSYKLRSSFKKLMMFLVPFSLVALIVTIFGVPFFYGSGYDAMYLPIALVITSSLLVVYAYFNAIFAGENQFSKFFVTIILVDLVLSLGLNVGLNYWMIQKWGIIGAPIATSITIVFKIGLNLYGIKRLRSRTTKY
jgi:O-antigen/teichoic acid export membrane protein